MGQAGFIGVYSDAGGTDCSLADSSTALCSYYVVHSLTSNVRGARFRISSEHLGTVLPNGRPFTVTVGNAIDGVEIDYGSCMDVTGGLHILTLNYFCQGLTPACARIEVVEHPTVPPPGLSANECSLGQVPVEGWTSYINNDGSCECALPDYAVITVTPDSLGVTLCPEDSSTLALTIENTGGTNLTFDLSIVHHDPFVIVATPDSGVVPIDSTRTIDVVFNSTGLLPGDYHADIHITSNDFSSPEIIIPAFLNVPAAVMALSHTAMTDTLPGDTLTTQVLTISNPGACDLSFNARVEANSLLTRSSRLNVVESLRERSGVYRGPLTHMGVRTFTGDVIDVVADAPEQIAKTHYIQAQPAGLAVALVAAGNGPLGELIATGRFSSVTTVDVSFVTPTLEELQAFDAVLVWWNYLYLDPVTLGSNLADYVDAGGGVVLGVPEVAGIDGRYLSGRWESEEYFVFMRSDFQTGNATLGTIHDPLHPVMSGVTTFDGGGLSYRPSSTALTTGAELIASWSDGMPLVATKGVNGTRRADLGFYPPSDQGGFDPRLWDITTDGALLMANALEWVAGVGVRWLSLDVTSGTIPGAGSTDITVTFDSAGLPPGTYTADIVVCGNDLANPKQVIPVSFQVGISVPVFIQAFSADRIADGVEIRWDVVSDEAIQGFRIYRSTDSRSGEPITRGIVEPETRILVDADIGAGTYWYTLAVVMPDGSELQSQRVRVVVGAQPLQLLQNYPNPFNPTTTIAFNLPESGFVDLSLYALDGKLVRTLVNQTMQAGLREVLWDGRNDRGTPVSSGVYLYRLRAGNRTLSRKMLYLK